MADLLLVGIGLLLYALICHSYATYASNPLATEPQKMVSGFGVPMLFFNPWIYVIHADELQTRLIWIMIYSIAACAQWQRLKAHLPYLLDPVARPPRHIELMDALVVITLFILLNFALTFTFAEWAIPHARGVLLAYALSGILTVTGTFLALRSVLNIDFPKATGLRPPGGPPWYQIWRMAWAAACWL